MTMTEAKWKLWAEKVSQSVVSTPKLSSLPPTTESFAQNAARTHLLVAVWRNALQLEPNPPQMEPRDFGWTQVARYIQHLFQMALHLHLMLCLKLSNAVRQLGGKRVYLYA